MTLFKTAGVAGVFFAQQTCQPCFSDFLVIILSIYCYYCAVLLGMFGEKTLILCPTHVLQMEL